MFLTCQSGYETLLERELEERLGLGAVDRGAGWVVAESGRALPDCVFAHLLLPHPAELRGRSVNALARAIADFFAQALSGDRIENPWPCIFTGPTSVEGLGRRLAAVQREFHEIMKKRFARVAKLASPRTPAGIGPAEGLWVCFAGFDRAFVSREAIVNGPRRMADDARAPSRSYLKVEEAYGLLGREPAPGETVADLGAAPGGWSYSAAKRGARVVAIDNGPLKGGALGHGCIEHRREDAFAFTPAKGRVFDWLFCDLVEEPRQVLGLADRWLSRPWCRRFIVNLKFGRTDPIALLRELRASSSPFSSYAPGAVIRHLYHDREELTIAGALRFPGNPPVRR
jgi:23S rRNA (cytidine2498-2'-O)-methyltransferase